jgi:hypothetical protein
MLMNVAIDLEPDGGSEKAQRWGGSGSLWAGVQRDRTVSGLGLVTVRPYKV